MANNAQGDAITLRQWLPLLGLTVSAFIFNTSEFMPVGLLTDIGSTFALNEAQTGIMISVYAWAVMLLSLPLMVAASRVEFKRLMLGVVAVFAAGQFLSAIAPTFLTLTLVRLVVACAHAIFWSIASIMGTRLVGAKHAPLALSMIATGTSVAQIFGLPIGRAIGLAVGWRMTFGLVGVVSVVVVLYQAMALPPMPAGEPFSLKGLPALMKNRLLMGIYVVTAVYASSYYLCYSYIEPFLAQVAGLSANTITMSLMAFGVAGIIASVICTRFYDGHRKGFITGCIAGVCAPMLALAAVSAWGLPAIVAAFVMWGICGTIYGIAFQAELIACTDKDVSAVAMSMYSGIFNFGIGSGTALGGIVVSSAGVGLVGIAGGALCAVSLVLCLLLVIRPLAVRLS